MKKKRLILLLIVLCGKFSFSQNQTNFWFFGTLAALDFNSGSPVPLTNGALNTTEGCAAISDVSGNLLFYTDGVSVWNKLNAQMPNGFGLLGDPSTTQSALIVPDPGNASLFYIFTIGDEGDDLNYSVVDITLAGGNGDVTIKNTFLRANMTEKLCGVFHCNGHDIWIGTHDWHANTFVSYLVTNAGVSAPVISSTGMTHTVVHGQMKFNSTGTKIACAIGYQDSVQVLDFDNSTGIISNPFSLGPGHHVYGLEFSPDNSKLYVTYYDVAATSWLAQFDLSAANVQLSQTPIWIEFNPVLYALQLAHDNKIYVTKEVSSFLGVVNLPNVAGPGCNYVDNVVNLDPGFMGSMCMLGLPGFIQSYFNPNFPNLPPCSTSTVISADFLISDTTICKGYCINFTDTSSGNITSWNWSFPGATPSSDTSQNPVNICYAAPGNYNATLIISNGINSDTVVKQVAVFGAFINAGVDTTINSGTSTQLNASGNTVTYSWSPGTGLSDSTIANPVASPTDSTTYYVTGIDSNGCVAFDSVKISVDVICGAFFNAGAADTTITSGISTQLNAGGNTITYSWSPGTGLSDSTIANPVASPTISTTYYVTGVDSNGCTAFDSVKISVDIKCGKVFVPTAFSPNNDSHNDVECVIGDCIQSMQFCIFDRWGEKVFETSDQKFCWDGTYNGKLLSPGIFAWFLRATLQSGDIVDQKGNISLVR